MIIPLGRGMRLQFTMREFFTLAFWRSLLFMIRMRALILRK